jgi:hypothetical protein
MKTRRSVLRLSASAPVLTLGLALGFAFFTPANKLSSASAQVTSPMGSYGILLNQWPSSNTGHDTTSALLGVLDFDGAGNVTATYTKVNADYSVKTGTATGTYSGNPDGSNTVSLTFDDGSVWTVAAGVTDGGSGLQLLVTGGDPMNAFTGSANPAEVFSGTGRIQSSQGTMPAGSYGYLLTGWPDARNKPFTLFGIINLDGAGNVNGSYTLVNGRPTAFPGTLSGTYSVNPDGTGSTTLNLDLGLTGTVAIVVTDGGSGILMLASVGNQVMSGTARMQ